PFPSRSLNLRRPPISTLFPYTTLFRSDITPLQDNVWKIDGAADLHHVEQVLETEGLIDDSQDYSTLAGYLLARFGHLPQPGDSCEYDGPHHRFRFEVLELDGRRIASVRVERLPLDPSEVAAADDSQYPFHLPRTVTDSTIYLIKAFFLGIIEGLTEFIPYSSTGHLNLFGNWIDFASSSGKVSEVVIQFGSILAVMWIFRARLWQLIHGTLTGVPAEVAFTRNLLLAFLPAAVIGAIFIKTIKQVFYHP